jgi:dipeptidyl aminopeptidase/acylaminoacyl peptidase
LVVLPGWGWAVDSLDFRVEVGGGAEQGYEVILRGPDGGEVSGPVQLPQLELESLAALVPEAVIASSARVRRAVTAEEKPVRELGVMLFSAVLGGRGQGMFTACRHQAEREGRALRVVLQVRPPELARLPWEFMFDPDEDDYVGLSVALVRCPLVSAWTRPLRVVGPLRVLGMTALPGDQHELAVMAERQRLEESMSPLVQAGQVELEWVAGQSWRDLRAGVRQGGWHVLHFIGHGGFDKVTEEGTLALAAEEGGRTYWLGADALAMMLREHTSLRLVVLNACDTGRASALDGFSSMAGALARRGVPAVLAMQQEITDRAALEFSRTFYEELARQPSVEWCVTQARQAIRLALPGSLEWGTPVLYMRSPDGTLFDLGADLPSATAGATGPADAAGAGHGAGSEAAALEELYTEGLDALYTGRWDEAVRVFTNIMTASKGYKDSKRKLLQARREQRLAAWYAGGHAAAAAGRWEEAIGHLAALVDVDPAYQDALQLLEQARQEQELARLRAEGAALHRAGRWAAVLSVGERLAALTPDEPDPDGLVASARAALEAERRARSLAEARERALRHIHASEWDQALRELTAIQATEPGYQDTQQLLEQTRRKQEAAGLRAKAAALHRAGKWAAVLSVGERLAALIPDEPDPDGLVASARAALEAKRRARSMASARQRALRHIHASEWDQALRELTAIQATEPGYQDTQQLLEQTRRKQETAGLRAEAAALHRAGDWAAVVAVGERLAALTPDQPDPDGLVASARAALEAKRRARSLAEARERALRHIHASEWDQALRELTAIQATEPGYQDVAQLIDWVRHEPFRSVGISEHPVELATFTFREYLNAVAFSPDGSRLAIGGKRGQVLVADLATGKWRQLRSRPRPEYADISDLAFDPAGRRLATAGDQGGQVWDLSARARPLKIRYGRGEQLRGVAFSPDGRMLAAAGYHGTARVWDTDTGTRLFKVTAQTFLFGVAFSSDGRLLAAAGYDGAARIWDTDTRTQLLQVTHDKQVNGVAFSPDGRLLATASDDGTARIWDTDTGIRLLQMTHDSEVNNVAFSPNGRVLATVGNGGTALWDANTGTRLLQVTRDRYLFGVAFSPDGRLLAIAGWSKTVQLWQLREEESTPGSPTASGQAAPVTTTRIDIAAVGNSRSLSPRSWLRWVISLLIVAGAVVWRA